MTDAADSGTLKEKWSNIHNENEPCEIVKNNVSSKFESSAATDHNNQIDFTATDTADHQPNEVMPTGHDKEPYTLENKVTFETVLDATAQFKQKKEYPHPKKRLRTARLEIGNIVENTGEHAASAMSYENDNTEKRGGLNKSRKRRVTMVKKKITCNNCGNSFKNLSVFGRHKKKCVFLPDESTREDPEIQCTDDTTDNVMECNSNSSNSVLHDDDTTHSKSEALICSQCNSKFHDKTSLKFHIQSHGNPKYKCDECEKFFQSKSNLTKHKRLHKKTFHCDDCNSSFASKENYDIHNCRSNDSAQESMQKKSLISDNKHVCDVCQKEFSKRKGMLAHRKQHSVQQANKFICKICFKGLQTKSSLMKHLRIVHSDSRNFVCDVCGKSFKQQDTLNIHLKTHDENRSKFECPDCGKGLASSGSLKVHLRTHQDVRPFMCDVCGMSFHQKGNLAKHMLSHTDRTAHQCPKCGKEFKYSETLKIHLRGHALKDGLTDYELSAYGKHYTCEICGKKMPSASQHKVHMRTHTNERPYECKFCRKRFKEGGKLTRHMRTHEHPEHNEHNYINNTNVDSKFTALITTYKAIKPKPKLILPTDQTEVFPASDVTVLNTNAEMASSNASYVHNTDYTNNAVGGLVMDEPSSYQNETLIDSGAHEEQRQYLMHQLTPVSNLMVQAPRQFQVPPVDMPNTEHPVHVGYSDENQVTPHVYSEVLVHSEIQQRPSNDVQPFNTKFL